ncbi:MAG: ribosome recycling factor [Candidatus Moranbacteria bacterium CG23_combo_of_CG06-09_8_20_14_all_35_22]|nr:MAG: ribosome recycling factor [Candidatus Moranbacteria bacterium CG23_combo_of_CG06-09_8_20_14_all_35_22]
MINEVINKYRDDFEKAISYFKDELGKLRTGRASVSLVEDLLVDYYGAKSPLKQIASITVPEARTIAIAPWSRDVLVDIEKAIRESQLNLNPINDGQIIRINLPALNEERRKEIVKMLNQKSEEARVSVRRIREEIWEEIQNLEKTGTIGEDDKFSGKDKLQKVVDEYNTKIEEIRKKKEEEIMTV